MTAACNQGGQDVEEALRSAFDAYNDKDVQEYLAAWTDEGWTATFEVEKEEASLVPPSWGNAQSFAESVVSLDSVTEVEIDEETATAVVETAEFGIHKWYRLPLTNSGGRWLLAGRTELPPPALEGAEKIAVGLSEFTLHLSDLPATRSPVFTATNDGTVNHELVLLRDKGGIDETVGRIEALAPGQAWQLVTRDLPPGRYALVCSLLTADGRSHAALGMRADVPIDGGTG